MPGPDEPHVPSVTVRAAVDVLLFAPLGLGAKLVDDAPKAIGQARRELSNARFIGRLAVDQGIKQVRSRFEPVGLDAPQSGREKDAPSELDPWMSADEPEPTVDPIDGDMSAADLALPDYDTLPAIDIVAKLETLDAVDRGAIERYESANRQRRTVLGKLAQLADL